MRYFIKKISLLLAIVSIIVLSASCEGKIQKDALTDGTYAIDVSLEGGSGRATIESPSILTINGDAMSARVRWSSPHYDYMIVGDDKYLPVNTEGNSEFEIPVEALDTAISIIGDTTAMSVPHEVEYEITFISDTITAVDDTPMARSKYSVFTALAIILFCIVLSAVRSRLRKKRIADMQRQ